MEQLRVIGSEGDALVLVTDAGDRFTVAVDSVLRAEVRRVDRGREAQATRRPRVSPRDIQSRVRAGVDVSEIAQALDIAEEDVQRYAGPVLAERDHVVDVALALPVLIGDDLAGQAGTFGAAMQARLEAMDATDVRWTSWKDDGEWIVKLRFTSAVGENDARWAFDMKRSALTPRNADAQSLSRHGATVDGPIPRLRALDVPEAAVSPTPGPAAENRAASADDRTTSATAAQEAARSHAPERLRASDETTDLLEALRRRRGQRPPVEAEPATSTTDAAVTAIASPTPAEDADDDDSPASSPAAEPRRRGRSAMPSWDEIVFGARSDES